MASVPAGWAVIWRWPRRAPTSRPDLKDPPFYPALPASLRHARSSADIFAAIRQQDILLHHPYDSFQPLIELIAAAAEDPEVLAIKQTLYRLPVGSTPSITLKRSRRTFSSESLSD